MAIIDDKLILDLKRLGKTIIFLFISIVIIILINNFFISGIDWAGFIEFVALCLILIFLIDPKINIKFLDILEIKGELDGIKRELNNLVISSRSEASAKATNKNLIINNPAGSPYPEGILEVVDNFFNKDKD